VLLLPPLVLKASHQPSNSKNHSTKKNPIDVISVGFFAVIIRQIFCISKLA
jgi:hypothetical protein